MGSMRVRRFYGLRRLSRPDRGLSLLPSRHGIVAAHRPDPMGVLTNR
jgi:hypothetical protein